MNIPRKATRIPVMKWTLSFFKKAIMARILLLPEDVVVLFLFRFVDFAIAKISIGHTDIDPMKRRNLYR